MESPIALGIIMNNLSVSASSSSSGPHPHLPHESDLISSIDHGVLSLIIVIGSSLSLVGLVFAFITYSLFSDLHSVSGTTMLNLLASFFLTQLLFVAGNGDIQAADLCWTLALALLYARLSIACWLLAATYDLFRHVVSCSGLNGQTCRPLPTLSVTSCKYYVLGWFVPIGPLALTIFSSSSSHLNADNVNVHVQQQQQEQEQLSVSRSYHNCWIPSYFTFLATFFTPCMIVLLITVYYLLRSLLVLKWGATIFDSKTHQKLTRRWRLQLHLFTRLTIYLFLIISTAASSLLFNSHFAWILFSCTSSFQGFFVSFSVTCNCQVLKLYSRSLRSARQLRPGVNYSFSRNEISKSSSLQLLTRETSPGNV